MDFLRSLIEGYNIPILSAFLLGLMTAISPCPLATNITATAYISKNITDRRKVLLGGFMYFLGRAVSYTTIGVAIFFGAREFHIARFFQRNGEKYLGPLLIILGLILLNAIRLDFLGKSTFQEKLSERFKDKGMLGSFLIGIIFALAFCPLSGALYFGGLIPLTVANTDGLYLPIVFALGTGLPVMLFTYLLAFTMNKVGMFYQKITNVEKVMRKITGVVFLVVGIYYVSIFFNAIML